MSSDLRVEWIRGTGEIEKLRETWIALENEVRNRTLYSRYDYVIPWYHCYAGTKFAEFGEPLVGLAWEEDRLVGIAPLINSRASFAKIPVRHVACAGYNLAAGELLIRDGETGVIERFVDDL